MKKRKLGQHFLYDGAILGDIVAAADVSPDDVVVEIGPGTGSLTEKLIDRAKKVIAIELDVSLYERLKGRFRGVSNLELVHADALRYDYGAVGTFKVVANIPYYITTPLIFRLFAERETLTGMTLMVQKELAERIASPPGRKSYGVLSIMSQLVSVPEIKFIVSRELFRPPPEVDSAVIGFKMLREERVRVADEKLFIAIVRTAFSMRRKTLSNNLKGFNAGVGDILNAIGINPARRPETLSIDEFARIANALA
ncbi:16S rRNA (adenine(1518)-N(6)/adenine(1519)-N(6))-dimethyltransferase RsmA [Candidatus Magnetominusculus dajiuhuensis]|uniref:16S rRNA (adenine(1518)-N(6)/adenine(1519)-N(6))- dimethyltransferase RsmA n=1 Tax=Candidatus Magnetominusculus dajiuhuensis TaxID=3137712 RepID=UPI003B4349A1